VEDFVSGKILIVDDNIELAEMMAALLQDNGYEILVRDSGKAALKAIPQFTPDLIVLDMNLPEATGMEVAQTLQAQNQGHLPILFITGSHVIAKNIKIKEENSHKHFFLSKPFKGADFLKIVNHLFQNRSFQGLDKS